MKLPVASRQSPVNSSSCGTQSVSAGSAAILRSHCVSRRMTIVVAALFLLAACAKPTAIVPHASQAEIAQERGEQTHMADIASSEKYKGKSYDQADIDTMKNRLQVVVDRLAPQGIKLCRELNGPDANCDMLVVLSTKDKGLNAHADGTKIIVNADMIDFASNDNQLAFILSHEYTHHIMGHVRSTQNNVMGGAILGTLLDALASSQGVNTQGQLGKMGAQTALLSYSPEFENEADYIGLYILARAGFKIEDAPQFWRQMATVNKDGIYTRTTHPTTPERFVTMNKTIAEIEQKKATKQRLLPNIRKEG